jgi:hypothetical protein
LMTISQVKFASKTQKVLKLLQQMNIVKLLLLERMEVTVKFRLIMKLFNLDNKSMLLMMESTMLAAKDN